jgi:polysaccharide biosynthesis transport protein
MNSLKAIQLNPQLASVVSNYWHWRKLWILTTVSFCVMGLAYAVLLKRDAWVASQALIVRDEATGAVMRLGRFESQTQMKASQETVLEMARNPQVVEAALKVVGRPARFFGLLKNDAPPSRSEIEDFARSSVVVRAPRGAELGTTEVIYLDVKQNSRERSVDLTNALCDALEQQLKSVRVDLAAGVIQELEAARMVCERSLQEATDELQEMEIEAGSDLADLRGLSDTNVGSTNRLMLDMVRDELRKADMSIRSLEPAYQLANAALEDASLVPQAAELISGSHPAISKLREGLADARVKTATLEGRFTPNHSEVLNARQIEEAFLKNLREELSRVVRGYHASIAISQQKINVLNDQEVALGKRLNRLADIRAKYSNLVAEVKSRGDALAQVKKELTQTLASRDAAQAASLITRLDTPVIGERPVGPGRSTIVGGATVGGLMFGLGVVFLLVPLDGRVPSSNTTPQPSSTPETNNPETKKTASSLAQRPSTSYPKSESQLNTEGNSKTEVRSSANVMPTSAPQKSQPHPEQLPTSAKTSLEKSVQSRIAEERPKQSASDTLIKPSKPDTIDEVRNLVANALQCHVNKTAD